MCTVTIIPNKSWPGSDADPVEGIRLVCNRDERRSRPAALPPTIRRFGRQYAILPVDPVSGGTWIAVSDAGLALTLLNSHPQLPRGTSSESLPSDVTPDRGYRSRGAIIPALLHCSTLEQAVEEAMRLDASSFPPFRLLITDRHEVAEVSSGGGILTFTPPTALREPFLATSSGLGDVVVELPRRALFNNMFTNGCDWVQAQDAFHRHQWYDRPQLSVNLDRTDARTVSITIVEVDGDKVSMTYQPYDTEIDLESIVLSLQSQETTDAARPRARRRGVGPFRPAIDYSFISEVGSLRS